VADVAAAGEPGAYGIVVSGLPGAVPIMRPQAAGAPVVEVSVQPLPDEEAEGRPTTRLSDDSASLSLTGGGRLEMARASDQFQFFFPDRPADHDILHPYFTAAAALFWQWRGSEALHAGAIATPAGAVLLLGEKGAGKSTTLAWLALHAGVPVLSDDLAVLQGRTVLAGPATIDLRPDGISGDCPSVLVRNGERRRVTLGDAAAAPLAGVLVLEWAETVTLTEVPVAARLETLCRHRAYMGLAPDPLGMLELASTPMVRAGRPQDLARLPSFAERCLARFS
jgi:hypothetical protein